MADEMDLVQDQVEQQRLVALEEHKRRTYATNASLDICCVCGDDIPEARKLAVPGCCKCIVCQAEFELMHGR